ncbi:Serine-threonine kinase receptor-associated protein [Stylophora pistillata]|uniref:Serine-threonine kinase receptor-associated protein n=1 Tax=Stylophora pistillata TaxID=50429 RepID=A0A2B4SR00_STYPI|nr:Serine-threonine kinase receptor-associated protein [Stylophora pistillata]
MHNTGETLLQNSQLCTLGERFDTTLDHDGKPMLRQGDTGDWIGTFEGHKGAVWSATLNKDVTKAATGAADFTAKVWDAISGDEVRSLPHKHIVKVVDFSPDGKRLLTASNEKLLRVFDLQDESAEPDLLKGYTEDIRAALWSKDGKYIMSGGEDKADGKRLLTASNEKLLRVFDLQDESAEPDLLKGYTEDIRAALWSKDGKYIMSGGEDKAVRLWDTRNMTEVKKVEIPQSVTSMVLSKDGSILVVTYDRTISFWDPDRMELIKSFDAPTPIFSASLHPSKSCFVAGGDDFKLYKFDYEDGKEIESFKGHFGPVHCVRYSPDGELYASGSEDGTLRLWQHTVGKTYGLWRAVNNGVSNEATNS